MSAMAEMKPKYIEIAQGKRVVVLTEDEYEHLLDRLDAAEARRALADSTDPELDWSTAGNEIISNRIAEIRKRAGITQRELARRLKVQPSTLSRWERPDANLTLSTLRNIAKALDCSVVELISP
jgi:DNA-binding XRE family transcriptional regulator